MQLFFLNFVLVLVASVVYLVVIVVVNAVPFAVAATVAVIFAVAVNVLCYCSYSSCCYSGCPCYIVDGNVPVVVFVSLLLLVLLLLFMLPSWYRCSSCCFCSGHCCW